MVRVDDTAEERFAELYRSLASPILAYAARRTSSAHDAADVMAETFVVAWRRIDDVPTGDEARPWLYGVARRVLANHHRGLRRQHRLSERVADGLVVALQESTKTSIQAVDESTSEMRQTLDAPEIQAALESLSERDQDLLMLVAWDDLTPTEIAHVLECSPTAVRVRLHRARTRFRTALESLRPATPPMLTPVPMAGPTAVNSSKELP